MRKKSGKRVHVLLITFFSTSTVKFLANCCFSSGGVVKPGQRKHHAFGHAGLKIIIMGDPVSQEFEGSNPSPSTLSMISETFGI